jgi:predicted MFS family arabinose efflux permease
MTPASAAPGSEAVLKTLAAAVFLIFCSVSMVAPLIPALSLELGATPQLIGLLIPAYTIPYGASTLLYGPLSDRVGRRRVLLSLLAAVVVTTFLQSLARSAGELIALRVLAGLCAGGIAPIALALVGDLYPYQQLGRPLGWIFGAIAGGTAFGSSFGAWLNPSLGWRHEFVALAALNAAVLALLFKQRQHLGATRHPSRLRDVLGDYRALAVDRRGQRTYAYVFLNGVFHAGLFSWLSLYLFQRYRLGDVRIGWALLGYGVPGMLLGPLFGRLTDRYGRNRVIPLGLFLAAACAFALVPDQPLAVVMLIVTALSAGFDLTQPPLVGIINNLDARRRGQAMGLNAFALFTGYGVGAYLFQRALAWGFPSALLAFGGAQAALGLGALWLFRRERAG